MTALSARPDRDLDRDPVAADRTVADRVPVIDLSDPEATGSIAAACRDWGFFQVTGHDVQPRLIEAVWRETRAFFALPAAEKRSLMRSRGNPWGYYDNELTKNQRDRKEVFDCTTAGVDPIYGAENRWPAGNDTFCETMTAWLDACAALSLELVGLMAAGLDLPAGCLERAFGPRHTGFLRLNYYPVGDPREDSRLPADMGVHHHTDAGALTVLMQDSIGGLQVHRDGRWHAVPPRADAFVVNTADMLQVWSNDRYRAPVHRVLASRDRDRYSLPFFFNPAADCVVEPLEPLVSPEDPSRYRPIAWREFRARRTDGDYADYGPEVQIAQFRIAGPD